MAIATYVTSSISPNDVSVISFRSSLVPDLSVIHSGSWVPKVATCDVVSFSLEGSVSVVPTDACDLSLYDALPFFPFGLDAITTQSVLLLHSLRGFKFLLLQKLPSLLD
jgi:hypothetical protein